MGEITQRGIESISKTQKSVSRRFPRAFKATPHLKLVATGGAVRNEIKANYCSRHSFKANVNAIPFVEQDHKLEWEATGEVEPFVYKIFHGIAALGVLVGLYAALVQLHWLPNVIFGPH